LRRNKGKTHFVFSGSKYVSSRANEPHVTTGPQPFATPLSRSYKDVLKPPSLTPPLLLVHQLHKNLSFNQTHIESIVTNPIHSAMFRDISPPSSPKQKRAQRLSAFAIPMLAKEDLPDSMKAVLRSITQKGSIADIEETSESNRVDENSKPQQLYSWTVMPRLRPKAKGRHRKFAGNRSTRRHAKLFSGEELYAGSLHNRRLKEQNIKEWLARNILCMG